MNSKCMLRKNFVHLREPMECGSQILPHYLFDQWDVNNGLEVDVTAKSRPNVHKPVFAFCRVYGIQSRKEIHPELVHLCNCKRGEMR